MTTTAERVITTTCPHWCTEQGCADHPDAHVSGLMAVDRTAPATDDPVFVELHQDAWKPGARVQVAMHEGDRLVFADSPAVARSIAVALVAAADRAEGVWK